MRNFTFWLVMISVIVLTTVGEIHFWPSMSLSLLYYVILWAIGIFIFERLKPNVHPDRAAGARIVQSVTSAIIGFSLVGVYLWVEKDPHGYWLYIASVGVCITILRYVVYKVCCQQSVRA